MRTALTIAGSDSGGGAGIQADLKTFAAYGVYGLSAITAVTAQNTRGVQAIATIPPEVVVAQIDAVISDIGAHATKIGMLATAEIILAVAEAISRLALPQVVLDPVMVAKGGDHLLDPAAVEMLRTRLLPLCAVLTPNIPEAETLTGRTIRSRADQRAAARQLVDMGARTVVVKGGHGESLEDADDRSLDIFFDGNNIEELAVPRVTTVHTHGTGCTFASAIAAALALGDPIDRAVQRGKGYVTGAITHAPGLGHGHGPLDHFWMNR